MTTSARDDKVVALQVTPEAGRTVDAIKDEFGLSKIEIVARIMRWVAAQPKSVRRELLESTGDVAGELVRLRLSDAELKGDVSQLSFEEVTQRVRALLDRLEQIEKQRRIQIRKLQKPGG